MRIYTDIILCMYKYSGYIGIAVFIYLVGHRILEQDDSLSSLLHKIRIL